MAFQRLGLKNYNQHSYWQQVENMLWLHQFARITKPAFEKKVVNVADFGSSEGANSIKFFGNFFSNYHSQRSNDSPVNIYHCDLPGNNWNSFFESLQSSPDSYLKYNFTHSRIIGKSFYNQLFENNYLDVGYGAFSFHYLSKNPEHLPEDYHYYHSKIQEQGMIDLSSLIQLRLNELCPGGYLFVLCCAKIKNIPSYISLTDQVLYNCMQKGLLTKEECLKMSSNMYFLDEDEIQNILNSFCDQLEVIEYRYCKSISPYYIEYINDKDYEKYVNRIYDFNNSLNERMLSEHLSSFGKSDLIEDINNELKKLFKESKIVPFTDYIVLALKKK